MLGFEGQAAALYFPAYASLLKGPFEFEKRTRRFFRINAARLARYVNDGNVEINVPDGRDINSLDDFPLNVLDDFVTANYGYDLLGRNHVDSESFAGVVSQDVDKPLSSYNLEPYEPIYYGGYIQDKVEFNDLVLNLEEVNAFIQQKHINLILFCFKISTK